MLRHADARALLLWMNKSTTWTEGMEDMATMNMKDGDYCEVVGGTHAGKSGTVRDIKTSKTGHVTITVVQKGGIRFKTLAKNVVSRKSLRA